MSANSINRKITSLENCDAHHKNNYTSAFLLSKLSESLKQRWQKMKFGSYKLVETTCKTIGCDAKFVRKNPGHKYCTNCAKERAKVRDKSKNKKAAA